MTSRRSLRRILPRIDLILDRESLDSCTQEVFVIMNGWYMHHPERFPPSPTIRPHITSLHITPSVAERLLSERVAEYFRAHGPVGCRDLRTKQLLERYGIEAYFSGCLTMTLNKAAFANRGERSNEILLVDLIYRYAPGWLGGAMLHGLYTATVQPTLIQLLLSREMKARSRKLSHFLGVPRATFEERFRRAIELLTQYATARLVITSRIHAALPCLAFDTPVLLVVTDPTDPRLSGYH